LTLTRTDTRARLWSMQATMFERRVNLELLTKAIERVMATKYGKTVTVRIEDVTGKSKEDGSARCSETD